jgi:hypothetical protein
MRKYTLLILIVALLGLAMTGEARRKQGMKAVVAGLDNTGGAVQIVKSAGAAAPALPTFTYFRITFTSPFSGVDLVLSEMYYYDENDSKIVDNNFTAASNGVATLTYAPSYSAGYKLFDGIVGAAWQTGWGDTAPKSITLQIPVAKTLKKYLLSKGDGYNTQAPKVWAVYGSNTGAFSGEETLLSTVADATSVWKPNYISFATATVDITYP